MINSFNGEYRFLSNFWLVPIEMNGTVYPSVENAYQASKFEFGPAQAKFITCNAAQAKRLGRQGQIRSDWNSIRLSIMETLIGRKFVVGSELSLKLLATEPHELVEGNTWSDRYWGVCNGIGDNHLGRLLMERRAFLNIYRSLP